MPWPREDAGRAQLGHPASWGFAGSGSPAEGPPWLSGRRGLVVYVRSRGGHTARGKLCEVLDPLDVVTWGSVLAPPLGPKASCGRVREPEELCHVSALSVVLSGNCSFVCHSSAEPACGDPLDLGGFEMRKLETVLHLNWPVSVKLSLGPHVTESPALGSWQGGGGSMGRAIRE